MVEACILWFLIWNVDPRDQPGVLAIAQTAGIVPADAIYFSMFL